MCTWRQSAVSSRGLSLYILIFHWALEFNHNNLHLLGSSKPVANRTPLLQRLDDYILTLLFRRWTRETSTLLKAMPTLRQEGRWVFWAVTESKAAVDASAAECAFCPWRHTPTRWAYRAGSCPASRLVMPPSFLWCDAEVTRKQFHLSADLPSGYHSP